MPRRAILLAGLAGLQLGTVAPWTWAMSAAPLWLKWLGIAQPFLAAVAFARLAGWRGAVLTREDVAFLARGSAWVHVAGFTAVCLGILALRQPEITWFDAVMGSMCLTAVDVFIWTSLAIGTRAGLWFRPSPAPRP